MRRVDYDAVAPVFDRRYSHNSYEGIERSLVRFIGDAPLRAVLEVGCGSGHWLKVLEHTAGIVAGMDLSSGMLRLARQASPHALLVRAAAERLPYRSATFDRVFCINALHHFSDKRAFLQECRRILSAGGAFLTTALDPHTGLDAWWVYDFFPASLGADLVRYPSTQQIRDWMIEAGFASAQTELVHHMPAERPFEVALARGQLDRHSTSQLMVISDDEWERGIRRLHDERPVIRSDLRLFATIGTL